MKGWPLRSQRASPSSRGTGTNLSAPRARQRSMPLLLRLVRDLALLGIAAGVAGGAVGGQWMRLGAAIMGAGLLPFGALIIMFCNRYGEPTLRFRGWDAPAAPPQGLSSKDLQFAFGAFTILVGLAFLIAAIVGGPGVTKPGFF